MVGLRKFSQILSILHTIFLFHIKPAKTLVITTEQKSPIDFYHLRFIIRAETYDCRKQTPNNKTDFETKWTE